MPDYHRVHLAGGIFFFTLVTHQRHPIFRDALCRQLLHEAFLYGMKKVGPFQIDAICLLPDHLHCIWTLPENDDDFSTRWKVIKSCFSRRFIQLGGNPGQISTSKIRKGEIGVWQRRYWEHMIRNQEDLIRHVEYIHFNPVKHGLVQSVKEWPWSSFHRYVSKGLYSPDWGKSFIAINSIDENFE